ncbi:MAG: hypothetical protein CM1200mP41_36060 [Gammaproteobacteria bacterium]|nr:MAG: hypothetical protein CM1200mP41_36060 [Gammaproteobacteria bacterium]
MIRLGMMGTGNISRDALTPAIAEVDDAVLGAFLVENGTLPMRLLR